MQQEKTCKFTPKTATLIIVLGVILTLAIHLLTNYPMGYTQEVMSPEDFFAEYKVEITDKIDIQHLSDYYDGDVVIDEIYVTTYHTITGAEYEEITVPYIVPILNNVPTAGYSDWRIVCGIAHIGDDEITGHIEYADGTLVLEADSNTAITSAPYLGERYISISLDELAEPDDNSLIKLVQLSCATLNSTLNPNQTATTKLIFTGEFTSGAMFAQPVEFSVETEVSYLSNCG